MLLIIQLSGNTPHWGGFYERLNRLVKSALRKMLWKAKLTYEEVETMLIEIEGVLNSRPLCYVDDSDLSEPLTPSHLMYGRNINKRHVLKSTEKEETPPSARMKHVQKLQDHFWKRFLSEYICGLRERDNSKRKKNDTPSNRLKIGDVVMIHQKHVARSSWPLGKVTRIIILG